jgi:hypothetical protein
MTSKFEFDVGQTVTIRNGAAIHAGRNLSGDELICFSSETQICIILQRSGEFDTISRDRYYVFLQQDQTQGWVNYYVLEKLDD